jgi:MFS transporter, DHA1 family, multidrug resistance protein
LMDTVAPADPVAYPFTSTPASKDRSYAGTIAFLALCQAMAAVAIDLILPAFPEIRAHLGLTPDSTQVSLLITAFFLGSGIAQLSVGILADRFGRKPILQAGLVLYLVAAIASTFAPTLTLMLLCRFVWGIGAAAPRTISIAMARDRFEGRRMAQTLSYVQGVFVIVPILAPMGGSLILKLGGWRWAMAAPGIVAVVLSAWLTRMPETLPNERRRGTSATELRNAFSEVLRIRSTVMLAGAIACMIMVINVYISLTELITDDTYGMADSFPYIFGAIAAAMGVAGFLNGNLVGRYGTTRLLQITPAIYVVIATIMLTVSLLTDGRPPFVFYCLAMAAMLAIQTLIFPNANGLAMQPVGHIAGLAFGMIGTASTILGAAGGMIITQSHKSGTNALAVGMFFLALVVLLLTWAATRQRPASRQT